MNERDIHDKFTMINVTENNFKHKVYLYFKLFQNMLLKKLTSLDTVWMVNIAGIVKSSFNNIKGARLFEESYTEAFTKLFD